MVDATGRRPSGSRRCNRSPPRTGGGGGARSRPADGVAVRSAPAQGVPARARRAKWRGRGRSQVVAEAARLIVDQRVRRARSAECRSDKVRRSQGGARLRRGGEQAASATGSAMPAGRLAQRECVGTPSGAAGPRSHTRLPGPERRHGTGGSDGRRRPTAAAHGGRAVAVGSTAAAHAGRMASRPAPPRGQQTPPRSCGRPVEAQDGYVTPGRLQVPCAGHRSVAARR